MKPILFAALFILTTPALYSQSITKIFIVRHAERTAGDDLTLAGLKRATFLKRTFGGAGIKRIFSTNFIRTRKTARPLADSLGLATEIYTSNTNLLNTVKTTGAGQRHFVVGHSDTVIDLITTCGCTAPAGLAAGIPATQFDNLFVLLLKKTTVGAAVTWSCEVMRLRYGAITD